MRQPNILDQPGLRAGDGAIGRHADVLVQGGQAYIFYFTHPGENRLTAPRIRAMLFLNSGIDLYTISLTFGHINGA